MQRFSRALPLTQIAPRALSRSIPSVQFIAKISNPLTTMSTKTALMPPLRWNLTPEAIASESEALMKDMTAVLDSVGSCKGHAVSFDSVIAPLIAMDRDFEARVSSVTFVKNVSASKEIRDAAAKAQTEMSAFEVKAGMRMDVYEAVKTYVEEVNPSLSGLDAEAKRFVERTMRDFKRRGLHLPEETRKQIEELQTRMSELSIKFNTNLAEDNTKLYFTAEELAGVGDDFIGSLTPSKEHGDKLEISLSYPHVVPILQLCKVATTRATVEKAFNSRATPQNVEVLETIVHLRRQIAYLMGYPNFAAFVLEERMAENPNKVHSFLSDLEKGLRPLAQADLESLAKLKAEEEGAGSVTMSDYRYYMERELKEKYSIDQELIKQYFPAETVLANMLAVYQTMLSLKFTLVDTKEDEKWHPDVQLYAVTDAREGHEGRPVGFFYLDLHPREGKYTHAAVFPHVQGCEAGVIRGEGAEASPDRVLPVCAMVCNFSKPTTDKPSLLRHSEVVTLFHEFGHVTHCLCSHTRFNRFASFRCEQDFVEAPSQMLENWCWQPETLRQLSGHYTNPSEKLPMELAVKLQESRIAHAGLTNIRQIFLATFDQELHGLPALNPATAGEKSEDVNTEKLLERLHRDILRIPMTPGTNFAATFGHLAGGYEASYYGYLWSEVYAADMFESVFKRDPLDKSAGLRYRDIILANGGKQDAKVFLREFLGREPSSDAFLRSKGLHV